MSGARIPVTRPMRVMPPRMTAATTPAASRPVTTFGVPKVDCIVSASVLAWMALPVMNAVNPSAMAKKVAIHVHWLPRPRSM